MFRPGGGSNTAVFSEKVPRGPGRARKLGFGDHRFLTQQRLSETNPAEQHTPPTAAVSPWGAAWGTGQSQDTAAPDGEARP